MLLAACLKGQRVYSTVPCVHVCGFLVVTVLWLSSQNNWQNCLLMTPMVLGQNFTLAWDERSHQSCAPRLISFAPGSNFGSTRMRWNKSTDTCSIPYWTIVDIKCKDGNLRILPIAMIITCWAGNPAVINPRWTDSLKAARCCDFCVCWIVPEVIVGFVWVVTLADVTPHIFCCRWTWWSGEVSLRADLASLDTAGWSLSSSQLHGYAVQWLVVQIRVLLCHCSGLDVQLQQADRSGPQVPVLSPGRQHTHAADDEGHRLLCAGLPAPEGWAHVLHAGHHALEIPASLRFRREHLSPSCYHLHVSITSPAITWMWALLPLLLSLNVSITPLPLSPGCEHYSSCYHLDVSITPPLAITWMWASYLWITRMSPLLLDVSDCYCADVLVLFQVSGDSLLEWSLQVLSLTLFSAPCCPSL